jgi:uncharacterized membrane protein
MKTKINVGLLFLCVGILNLLFLLDTILTDPMNDFSIFSIDSSKTINTIYYSILSMILIGIGIYYVKRNNIKNKKLK